MNRADEKQSEACVRRVFQCSCPYYSLNQSWVYNPAFVTYGDQLRVDK